MTSNYQVRHETDAHRWCFVRAMLALNRVPKGTKAFVVSTSYLAFLEADASWFLGGGNALTHEQPERLQWKARAQGMVVYAVLIAHSTAGLIFCRTGCGKVYPEEHELDQATKKDRYVIKHVKHSTMGHLHLDHAGGLVNWIGTYVLEVVHTLCADLGIGMKHYLSLDLNWKTFDDSTGFPRITIHNLPGHTAGLVDMQLNLEREAPRDHQAWFNSNNGVKRGSNYEGHRRTPPATVVPR
ncbi:hypothetical protein K437DRAFT_279828 [Tilletiaria anomala UBC 951]|uniref:Metallo-beta-lactamase domain-containing protein n=1 Tax=Tilletiaria anomala (strain ATCC 24038 / CBS 436.72 / UBC 951) TaxID=1037660 RepID=A0A066V3I6_TILAU|nr:uncharacterized protein K437DRAFT_279828 [Tilletiaria anomala UBC 951]KDN36011.1 hypothetical protein K437DRAFT_279828 [Tilletiaria anomala UBC 951]